MNSSTIDPLLERKADLNAGSWPAALTRPIKHGISWIGSRRRLHRDIEALRALDDRILRDIGLSRSDIDPAVQHGRDFDRYKDRLRQ